jgi:hypothetical protein
VNPAGVKVDGKRRRSRRPLILVGALALLTGLAFLVARPSVPDPTTNPYAGKRGGSLDKSAGLLIRYRRGDEVRSVEPQTVLRAGDVLDFKVRGEEASYLEVRLRDGAGAVQTIFPTLPTGGAPNSVKVSPGDTLPVATIVAPGGGKLVLTALFSETPRPVGAAPDPDTLTITAVVAKE